jgi:hypothetical protein
MPTITAQSIINKAKITLQDTTNVRWADTELLAYLNDGQREICMKRPDACSVLANITLVAGTRQAIPDAGTAILRVVRNMGTNGTTPGRAVRHVPMDLLDANVPNWHAATPVNEIVHVAVDLRIPQNFYVYPPANSGVQLEAIYAAPPAEVAAVGNTITVDDVFATPLFDYICFRAYTKDQESTGNVDRAKGHRELFDSVLDGKAVSDAVVSAKQINMKG